MRDKIKEGEMGGVSGRCGGKEECIQGVSCRNLKERDNFE